MRHDQITRYRIEIDVLDAGDALGERRANELLRSEFALALNAAYFSALSAGDIGVRVRSCEAPQEGVGRYAVDLELVERSVRMTDEQAAELLQREFRRALNASHFWRVCREDMRVRLLARERAVSRLALAAR